MDELGLFTVVLGLSGPWRVTRTEFDPQQAQLDLYLSGGPVRLPGQGLRPGWLRGARHHGQDLAAPGLLPAQGVPACPGAAGALPRAWRAPSQRALGAPGLGVHAAVEALVLTFAAAMPMATLAAMTREHDTGVWRIVAHHVHAARDQLDCCGVRRVGVDETSARTGQDYVSIFADLDARRVLFATEDRGADTVARFAA
ncbi:MAG: transposase, partial [Pseudonocardiaceae bacterium]